MRSALTAPGQVEVLDVAGVEAAEGDRVDVRHVQEIGRRLRREEALGRMAVHRPAAVGYAVREAGRLLQVLLAEGVVAQQAKPAATAGKLAEPHGTARVPRLVQDGEAHAALVRRLACR